MSKKEVVMKYSAWLSSFYGKKLVEAGALYAGLVSNFPVKYGKFLDESEDCMDYANKMLVVMKILDAVHDLRVAESLIESSRFDY